MKKNFYHILLITLFLSGVFNSSLNSVQAQAPQLPLPGSILLPPVPVWGLEPAMGTITLIGHVYTNGMFIARYPGEYDTDWLSNHFKKPKGTGVHSIGIIVVVKPNFPNGSKPIDGAHIIHAP